MISVVVTNIDASPIIQMFLKEPENISVKEGDNVTLLCSVENRAGVVQWTKDDFGLGTSRDLQAYNRYRMMGKNEGTWNLEIVNVTLDDEAIYQCQVGATIDVQPIRSKYAKLTVITAPLPPVLSIASAKVLSKGEFFNASCISIGGKPAPRIKWKRKS